MEIPVARDSSFVRTVVSIIEPEEGLRYSETENVHLKATLSHPEGIVYPERDVEWSSDIMGSVGQLLHLSTKRLIVGNHTIKLEVTDDGFSVDSSTRIEVVTERPIPSWSTFTSIPQSDPWFDVYELMPGVFAIHEPHQGEQVLSHLIVGEDRALLFDSGLGVSDIKGVVEGLTDLPIVVLNSHGHFDHVGGNYQFDMIYGRDTSFSEDAMDGISNAEIRPFAPPESFFGQIPTLFDPEHYAVRPFEVDHVVRDQEVIDLGGIELEIIFTPGHTPDALFIFDRTRGLLFMGDTFYAGPLYAMLPESDLNDYSESAKKLLSFRASTQSILAGHNRTLIDPLFLDKLYRGFRSIENETVRGESISGGRYLQYRFEGFSILSKTGS